MSRLIDRFHFQPKRIGARTKLRLAAKLWIGGLWLLLGACLAEAAERPNVLIAISDDQSYPHASAYGEPVIRTPGFDQVARRGMLFHNAFTPAPGCSPMRAALLTGQYIWQLREAGTHGSYFPRDLTVFPQSLAAAGYRTGYTGKAWGPGDHKTSGWPGNPAGKAYSDIKSDSPEGISRTDYAANFAAFLEGTPDDQPFCFWFGGHEPHRRFGKGLGADSGMSATEVRVPGFLPDAPEVRSDLLDYFFEIQWFDQHLARMLRLLEQEGKLDNTLVIVTSDNGMSFPRAKANLYEYGIHMPLAISWPERYAGNQSTDALVNLIDITATIYDVCDVAPSDVLSGRSLDDLLTGRADGSRRKAVYSGRERHSSSRWNSLGYPCRCVRTENYLYIRNYTPERWPAGAPRKYSSATYDAQGALLTSKLGPEHGGYHDIDACPTLGYMIAERSQPTVDKLLQLAVAHRPREELYYVAEDPGCLRNLVNEAEHQDQLARHRELLTRKLTATGDLREISFDQSHVWETYPRVSSLRWFPKPAWADHGQSLPVQSWLEQRRPTAKTKP